MAGTLPDANPLWYKDAIIYELHPRAFADSDADGIGDFRGLTGKLDYLQDLGITTLWLLPFYPSPLKDDGYDIADYVNVHPNYGNLRDFKSFLREAHRRGLRVITELVLNHTSAQHPWFQRARTAPPNSSARNFYVWSDTTEKYKDTRIIFKDFENSNWAWDPVADAYFWHRFYSHQPDLNYESPDVHRAVLQALDFWLSMGVDGLRLDAVPYLYEREGTNCENLPETHAFLKKLRRHADAKYANRLILAEANQWPEDAVDYFGDGDECHMAFHFPVMPRLFMALRMEDRFPIIDILEQTPAIPDNCQWATFLRNHDELTLEMVTDEERDFMYRVYAQDPEARINLGIRRRLAPLLGNHRGRIELMNGLLFSLPGAPVIYYGDEIGMGDNIYLGDRNGVRTPMQWSADRNAGFSRANPQRLYLPIIVDPEYHYESINVEAQQRNPHSLLWWMKRLIALRKRFKAFSEGSLEFLHPENRKVLAFIRRLGDEVILVVANLSRFSQFVELNLAEFKGMVPVEVFGHTRFPMVGDLPYLLTLGPHSFQWFTIEPERSATRGQTTPAGEQPLPILTVDGEWLDLFRGKAKTRLEAVLAEYIPERRWFGGKARQLKGTTIVETIPVPFNDESAQLALVRAEYSEGDPETYVLPLARASGVHAEQLRERTPHAVVAQLRRGSSNGEPTEILYDALSEGRFGDALLDAIARRRHFKGIAGELSSLAGTTFRATRGPGDAPLAATVSTAEQSNSSLIFGDRLILKVFRKLGEGINPDYEIGRFLTETANFPHTAPVAGTIEYSQGRGDPTTVALLHGFVPNEGDAWRFTLDSLGPYFERVAAREQSAEVPVVPEQSLVRLSTVEPPALAEETIGGYLEIARHLGQRTAEMHLALATLTDQPAFTPEPFSALYQRSLYQSLRSLLSRVFHTLDSRLPSLPAETAESARELLGREGEVLRRFRSLVDQKINASRIRCHGDFHLGQVLYTGRDFVIIDFEGEPARSLSERRIKRSPLIDVAGMLRSFHYGASTGFVNASQTGVLRPEDLEAIEPWVRFWHVWVSAAFLKSYLATSDEAPFIPASRDELTILLDAFLLEKAIYELGYELNHRPSWVRIPLGGIVQMLSESR